MIHIGRDGTRLGAFSEFDIRQGLKSGRFMPTDLGWKEGMENWSPLAQFDEFQEQPEEPPLPEVSPWSAPVAEAQPAEREGLPWDHRSELGWPGAFFQTVRLVLFAPGEAFSRMRRTGPLAGVILFNLIGSWAGVIFSALWALPMANMKQPAYPEEWMRVFAVTPAQALLNLKLMILMGPILVTLLAVFIAVAWHLLLMLAGGANKSFDVTLRVVCHALGSAAWLKIIPGFGGLLSPLWTLALCVVGLAKAHETSTTRTGIAGILALAALVACIVAIVVLSVFAVMHAGGFH